jgi:hypothetical protein
MRPGAPPVGDVPTDISLPFASFARAEAVATVVVVGQTLVLVGLLVAWALVVAGRPREAVASDSTSPGPDMSVEAGSSPARRGSTR